MVREQRRITVSMRHLGGRQQGIQADHAGTEFVLKYYDTPEWQRWARKDKTIILLEAFTDTQLQQAYDDLKKLKVPVTKFHEPDFNNSITSICFLVDAYVWNTKKYPNGKSERDIAIREIKNRFPLASG
jgi:hypothetical protein